MALGKIKEDAANAGTAISGKAKELGKEASKIAKKGASEVSEKIQRLSQEIQVKYYNPVTWEDFESESFDIPKMIVVVDEDERKGVEICEGSIGWKSKKAGMEVLHLYEEAVENSNLRFHPVASCYTVYFQDPFDRGLYIDLSEYLDIMQQNKVTEIKEIAHKLGAKRCKIEISEESKKIIVAKGKAKNSATIPVETFEDSFDASLSEEAKAGASAYKKWELLDEVTFTGDAKPQQPDLKWFKTNKEMLSLIRMRCDDGPSKAQTYSRTIKCSSTSNVSLKMAKKIDFALAMLGARSNFSFKGEYQNESRRAMRIEMSF